MIGCHERKSLISLLVFLQEELNLLSSICQPCCSMDLVPQLVIAWTAENVNHILEFGKKVNLDSLQEGLIPDTESFPYISILSFLRRTVVGVD